MNRVALASSPRGPLLRRIATAPRLGRGSSVETSRGEAAAATWTFRGDERATATIRSRETSAAIRSVPQVTGGALGLGRATVERFLKQGGKACIFDMSDAGDAVAKELGSSAIFAKGDVRDEADVQAAIDAARNAFGRLDVAVSCAGIAPPARVLGKKGPHKLELFADVLNVNVVGTFNVCRLAAAAMASNEPGADGLRGVLVNTASIAAFDGQVGQVASPRPSGRRPLGSPACFARTADASRRSAETDFASPSLRRRRYAASKAAVAGMTLPMARDLARTGVRCVTIASGGPRPTSLGRGLWTRVSRSASPWMSRVVAAAAPRLVPSFPTSVRRNARTIRVGGASSEAPRRCHGLFADDPAPEPPFRRRDAFLPRRPGLFNTPMMEGLPPHIKDELAAAVPFPSRLGDPAEYAKLVEAIVDNPMLNGETIRLDGSYRMPP